LLGVNATQRHNPAQRNFSAFTREKVIAPGKNLSHCKQSLFAAGNLCRSLQRAIFSLVLDVLRQLSTTYSQIVVRMWETISHSTATHPQQIVASALLSTFVAALPLAFASLGITHGFSLNMASLGGNSLASPHKLVYQEL
jgi:hypothetical protein